MADLENDDNVTITPIIKKKENIYIDPPPISDGVPTLHNKTRFNKQHDTITDPNKVAHVGGILQKLGCAIYKAKTNVIKDNVYLTNLPKGYYIKRELSRTLYIGGHPSGHKFFAETFVPHFLWLEDCWRWKDLPRKTRSNCACVLCPLPEFKPTISFEMDQCTIETFKVLDKIEIGYPPIQQEFYPKPFTIPLPSVTEPAVDISILLSSEKEND